MTASQFFYVFMLGSLIGQGVEPERASVLAQQCLDERILKCPM